MDLEKSGRGRKSDFVPFLGPFKHFQLRACAHPTLPPPNKVADFFEPHVLSNLVSHLSPFIYLFLPTPNRSESACQDVVGRHGFRAWNIAQDFFAHPPNSSYVLGSIQSTSCVVLQGTLRSRQAPSCGGVSGTWGYNISPGTWPVIM